MLGVAAFHFLADLWPAAGPETFQIIGDLQGALGWRKQAEEDFHSGDFWRSGAAEGPLNYDFDYRTDYQAGFVVRGCKFFIFYFGAVSVL